MANVILISPADNVGVVIDEINKNDKLVYTNKEGKEVSMVAEDNIKIYHKVALEKIEKGKHIIKYGEHIGISSKDINIGEHVHTHNVEDNREDLSLVE